MNCIIDAEGLKIIHITEFKANETDFIEAVKDAIYNNSKGHYNNIFYPIIINNQVIFAWINNQHFVHWFIKKDHMQVDKHGHIKIIDTIFSCAYKKIIEQVKEDNTFLINNGQLIERKEATV